MKLKNATQGDERAVSPVIGVILMVAITVILAAVIGTFVLGLGDQLGDSTPQASFDVDNVDASADEITIRKTGGEDIAISDLRVVVDVEDSTTEFDLASRSSGEDNWRTADTGTVNLNNSSDSTFTVRSGTATVSGETTDIVAGNDVTVTIVHKPSGGPIAERTATA